MNTGTLFFLQLGLFLTFCYLVIKGLKILEKKLKNKNKDK